MMRIRAALLFAATAIVSADNHVCTSETNTFTTVVDLFAGELGYYTFEECGDTPNPTIGIELGESYTFIQKGISNWFHPLGFAYFPDGAHADSDELEPVISQTGSNCTNTNECPTPRYFLDGNFLGANGTENFGLDDYEPAFFVSPPEWAGAGTYSVELTFDDFYYQKDIFYFCHIHQYMSGRIKILKDGVPVNTEDDPPLDYAYDDPGEFDRTCGTFGLDAFQLPNPVCPDQFVCGVDEATSEVAEFSACIDAMNCHMLSGMTTGIKASSPTVLFIHQMIPHHQNAVNMAKAVLKDDVVSCEDITDEENQDCIMEVIFREIINGQNHQIQKMMGYLEAFEYPLTDNCDVEIKTVRTTESVTASDGTSTNSANNDVRSLRDTQEICTSENNTFTAVVNLFAGELGYYSFEECGNAVNPTIGIELGRTYKFIQKDRSNWYHPIGFAYFPDGAHADSDELEPVISQTGSNCIDTNECPAPRYFLDDDFLGIDGSEDFGLDVYEPQFFASPRDWSGAGTYSVELTFDDPDYAADIFYFCHIHQFMSGRIKILKDGVPVSTKDEPPLGYAYDEPGDFDQKCGTFGLDSFQLPNAVCPDQFVCGVEEVELQSVADFSACIDAMNCHMLSGMTTGVKAASQMALFIHQMIPHHQNAINMAKTLLHENVLVCEDLADEDNQDCIMEAIIREIVNTQNHQIQKMLSYLDENDYPVTDNCDVEIETVKTSESTNPPVEAPAQSPIATVDLNTSGSKSNNFRATAALILVIACLTTY